MTHLCLNGDGNQALPKRSVCRVCYQARQRELARMTGRKAPRESPLPMTWQEFEGQYEPSECLPRRIRKND
jgi:hypothetical protein